MKLDIYHIDAFADQIFQGNPAAVCILDNWLPDAIMQGLAAELNLSETAFVVAKSKNEFRIRWFAPLNEVALCGHATLATAHVFYHELNYEKTPLRFHSQSGPLITAPDDFGICMDFPIQPVSDIAITHEIADAAGKIPQKAYAGEDLILIYDDASEISILEPDLTKIRALPYRGVCVSAPDHTGQYDFVSRFFAPSLGIDEDPVTGSAYTKLVPIYAETYGKHHFNARQVSARGGNLQLHLQGERIFISGRAKTVMQGKLTLPSF